MKRRWIPKLLDAAAAERLARDAELSPLLAGLLVQRGARSVAEARAFLDPRLASLPDPFALKGVPEAAAVLADALARDEAVAVLGDYDVDGITSVSQVLLFWRALGRSAAFSIPHRVHEGYGLSEAAVARFLDAGVQTFVTVDTGSSEIDAITAIKARGARVVVIDHHEVGAVLPPADAIVNPKQAGCVFPDPAPAACALTFYVLSALKRLLVERGWFLEQGIEAPDMRNWLDLVALGTVADVVPLVGVNRVLARHGLMRLRAGRRPGLKSLVEVSRIRTRRLDSGHVSWQLAPRLNAGGRVDVADTGVHLILSEDALEAARLARHLDSLNDERRRMEREAVAQAVELVQADPDRHLAGGGLVVADARWHLGVVGIMASRLADRFKRPALVLARDGEGWRGSGRSIEGFDLVGHLEAARARLLGLGGHAFACGLAVTDEALEAFAAWFRQSTVGALPAAPTQPTGEVDACVSLGDVLDPRFVEAYRDLWPFGEGNPRPRFLARDVEVAALLSDSGSGRRYRVRQGGAEGVLTVWSADLALPEVPTRVDLVFRLDLFEHRGVEVAGLSAEDLGPPGGQAAPPPTGEGQEAP